MLIYINIFLNDGTQMADRHSHLNVLPAASVMIAILLITDFVSSTLVVVPSDTVAIIGSNTQLYCSTNLPAPVQWQHIPRGSKFPTDVYLHSTIVNGYVGRFHVQVYNSTGAYNLVINNTQFEDAGVFRCLDNQGQGEQKDAKLNVTESTELQLTPKSAEVQEGESFQFTCKTYYKDEAIRWQRIPMENTFPVDVYLDDLLVDGYDARYEVRKVVNAGINVLIIKRAELRDSGVFRCIDRSGHGQQVDSQLTVVGPLKCHSSFNASCELEGRKNVTLTCSVNYSGKTPPTIEWKHEGEKMLGATSTIPSDGVQSFLTIQIDQGSSHSSSYSCLSQASNSSCTIAIQQTCTVSGESTVAPMNESTSDDSNIAAIVAPIVIVFVVVVVFVIIVVYVIKRRRSPRASQRSDPASRQSLTATK